MKPETADALEHAKEHLAVAQRIRDASASAAGREGYLAALSAARGLAFELLHKGPKTHKGVRALMHELVQTGVALDARLLAIFDEGFDLKLTADYGNPRDVSASQAEQAIAMAAAFIANVEAILGG